MNQNYSCTELFPTWYKSIEIKLEEDLALKRITAVQSIIKSDDLEFILDIVRIATDRKCQDSNSKSNFETHFRDNDINFPLASNDNLLKILAQITLCFLFESKNKLATIVSLAVLNVNFFIQLPENSVPYFQYARRKLAEDSSESDEQLSETNNQLLESLENFEEDEEETSTLDYDDSVNTIKMLNHLYKENMALKEETNVLWWLFGEYSSLNGKYFNEIGHLKMIISSAKELYDLSIHGNYNSSRHILNKALLVSNGDKPLKAVVFSDTIDILIPEVRVKILESLTPSDLTPCLMALQSSQELEGNPIWKATFEARNKGTDISKKMHPTDIAYQFYNEILYLNLL